MRIKVEQIFENVSYRRNAVWHFNKFVLYFLVLRQCFLWGFMWNNWICGYWLDPRINSNRSYAVEREHAKLGA